MTDDFTPKVFIVADDLTGALDSAVAFAGADTKVVVARHPGALPEALAQRPDVLAVSTASREIAEAEASARVSEALAAVPLARIPVVIKKVDSRLKGHPGAETAVLADAMGAPELIISPAIPDMGRVVRDGALQGSGVATPIPIAPLFDDLPSCPVTCPDSESAAQLDAAVAGATGRPLWVGARGLAMALARHLGITAAPPPALDLPLMIASGSRDPVTLAQLDALTAPVLDAPDGAVPQIPPGAIRVLSIRDGGGALSGAEAAGRFAAGTLRALDTLKPRALMICGGETAHAILDQMRADSLQVTAEFRPGLPLCRIAAPWGPLQLVTKSGGFGDPGLLQEVLAEAATERGVREGEGA
ncbi:MAG: four-carbon acid sugar kinase family protein [Rhodobacteraceae bacterium]|nr:four-carbon acid sugar kinase family protein [Paracoccaceae bacterium]MBR9819647.1 four-carbon acid sugar kinase family protein [Paracoccaceae bacterium]